MEKTTNVSEQNAAKQFVAEALTTLGQSAKSHERDASPVRKTHNRSKKPERMRVKECRACGRKKDIVHDTLGEEWICKRNCGNEDNHGCGKTNADGTKMIDYEMYMFMYKPREIHFQRQKKTGILDVVPKICKTNGLNDVQSKVSYTLFGMYQIAVKNPTNLNWLFEAHFKIVQILSENVFMISDLKHTASESIYAGPYPADQSLALLEPGRMWYHCELTPIHRRPMSEILKILTKHCKAITIITNRLNHIEIPFREEFFADTSSEAIANIVTKAYAKRNSELRQYNGYF